MKRPSIRILVSVALLIATLPLLVAAVGSPSEAALEHRRVVEFWTNERVSQAQPRDFVFDVHAQTFRPAKGKPPGTPGGGGGGGGGDDEEPSPETAVITGASWNGNGEIDGASGKVLFSIGGSYYVCSATVVEDGASEPNITAIIVTAAHCAYDETNETLGEGFAENWMFVPDYDDSPASLDTDGLFCDTTAYGCWTATAITVHNGYASAGSFGAAVEYDFAFVKVGLGGFEDDAGKLADELDATVGEQNIEFNTSPSFANAFGYPAAKKWKGTDLIYCAGPVDGDPYNDNKTYRMDGCKLTGGSSGGPWLFGFVESTGSGTVMSVNSYRYSRISAMHGPLFNTDTKELYEAAKTATGNSIIP